MNFAEELKAQLNIVDVVGQYVRLKRSGSSGAYTGLCPFHSDKTPSFNVHGERQFYKCFGCDAKGDVFNFVMQIESLTFPETLKLLAERYGIAMPERHRTDDPDAAQRAALYEMHEIAADLFQKNLRSETGTAARAYLETRGVSKAAIDEFRLGLSDASGQQLASRLQRFGGALLEKSALVRKREQGGGFYDFFRGRLMFPIHSESGKIIAFGGRALGKDEKPKYLNSSDSKIYKKSAILFNFHRAKLDARKNDRMILVEGYMDAIGIYSAGVHEVVAICGTSLSSEQVRAVRREISYRQANNGQIILNLDPDAAGSASTEKHISALLAEGLRVKVLSLPDDLDPDEYIQKYGAEAYANRVRDSVSYFHWLAQRARERFDTNTAEGRVDAFKFIAPALRHISDRIERATIASEIAEYLKIDREVVHENMQRSAIREKSLKPRDPSSAVPPNEKLLLACLLSSEEARAAIRHYFQNSEVLSLLELRPIFEVALTLDSEDVPFSVEKLAGRLDPRLQQILTQITFSEFSINDESAAQQALHCLKALESMSIRVECDKLRGRIRQLEQEGNFSEALRLTTELDRIRRASPGA